MHSHVGIAAGLITAALMASLALPAFAEETSASADASVSVSASATTTKPRPGLFAPLQKLNDVRKEILDKRETNVNAKLDAAINASTTRPRMEDKLEHRADVIEKRQENVEKRGERMDDAREKMMMGLKMKVSMMIKRHQAAIDRFSHMITRIESRIEKLKTQNVDTAAAATALASAKVELTAASTDLASIKAMADAAIAASTTASSTASQDTFKGIREKLASSEKHIKAAFEYIKDALESLRKNAQAAGINVSVTGSAGVGAGSDQKTGDE